MTDKIIPDNPKIGIVVGTFAAVPYIHMHLEARKRLYPDCPILIHDDCSDSLQTLNRLCSEYEADLSFSSIRHGHIIGDMVVFWSGLLWAKRQGIDILVKFSRRFIPLTDFRPSLTELAVRSQYATYSAECTAYGFGFRTEAMGMHVETWLSQHQIADFRRRTKDNDMLNGLPESFFHTWAANVHPPCDANKLYEKQNKPKHGAYGNWHYLGNSRNIKYPHFLWHNSSTIRDYAMQAKEWGLSYEGRDFKV